MPLLNLGKSCITWNTKEHWIHFPYFKQYSRKNFALNLICSKQSRQINQIPMIPPTSSCANASKKNTCQPLQDQYHNITRILAGCHEFLIIPNAFQQLENWVSNIHTQIEIYMSWNFYRIVPLSCIFVFFSDFQMFLSLQNKVCNVVIHLEAGWFGSL